MMHDDRIERNFVLEGGELPWSHVVFNARDI